MIVTDLFNFVIDQSISDEDVDDYLEKVLLSLSIPHSHCNDHFKLPLFLLHDKHKSG